MPHQFDLFAGMALRDAGMAQVAANGEQWQAIAYEYLVRLTPRDCDVAGETIRVIIINAGCPYPHSKNSWGPLIKRACRTGILKFQGFRLAQTKSRHASAVRYYRRV